VKITEEEFAALARSVKHHESRSNPAAVSNKGAVGTMQTMPETLRKPGFGVKPAQNDSDAERERVGTDYLRAMVARSPDLPTALAAYNWGPGKVDRLGVDKAPKATREYIANVTSTMGQGSQPPTRVAQAAPPAPPPARVVVPAPRPVTVAQAAPPPPMPDFKMPAPAMPAVPAVPELAAAAQAAPPVPELAAAAQAAPPGAIGGAVAEPPPPGAVTQAAALPPVIPPEDEAVKQAAATQQAAAMSPAARRMAHLRQLSSLGEMADRGRDSDLADMLAMFQAYRNTR